MPHSRKRYPPLVREERLIVTVTVLGIVALTLGGMVFPPHGF
jgi:hypothetical protein